MEQVIPIEECAKQRLQVLVYAYTLLIKNLMEEGVDQGKVKRASDKVWTILGAQAAEELKTTLGETINIESLKQAGAIAENVHGIDGVTETTQNELQSEFTKCPWQDAWTGLGIPEDWRFCASGHAAFAESMFTGLNPTATFKLTQNMPAGDPVCKGVGTI